MSEPPPPPAPPPSPEERLEALNREIDEVLAKFLRRKPAPEPSKPSEE
jgi:hypothetical protein